jgi:putative endonuclease
MFYLYILKSKKDESLYIGSTNNLRRRLFEHNNGKSKYTKSHCPFELKYYEAYLNESDARTREKSLKLDGRALYVLKNRIAKSLQ